MKSVNVSVIVPVFNSAMYLHNCIDSILAQQLTDFELLLIDDGSTDESGAICDNFAKNDPRIKVFHISNCGSAAAREFGFLRAVGTYIAAVDSDDWVDPDYLMHMYTLAETNNADMVMTAYYQNDAAETYIENRPKSNNPVDWQVDLLNCNCHAGFWNKLIRRDILSNSKVLKPSFNYYEDMVLSISVLCNCDRLYYDKHATYHYRVNHISLTNNPDIAFRTQMLCDMLSNMKDLLDYLSDEELRYLHQPILDRINDAKIVFIKQHLKEYSKYKYLVTQYFPQSYPITKANSIHKFAYYCALKGWIFPYKCVRFLLE